MIPPIDEALSDPWLNQQLLEWHPSAIALCDATQTDHPIIYVNSAFEQTTGYTRAEVLGKNPRFLHQGDDHQPQLAVIRQGLHNHKPIVTTLRNYRKDGTLFLNELRITPIYNQNKQLAYFISVHHDITHQLDTEATYRHIVDQSVQGITIHREFVTVFANHTMEQLTGYTLDEYTALTFEQLIETVHPDDRAAIWQYYTDRIQGKTDIRELVFRAFRKDGSLWWCETLTRVIDYQQQPAILSTYLDVTQRVEAEDQLRESSAHLRAVLDSLRHSTMLIDTKGAVLLFDKQSAINSEAIFGKPLRKGASIYDFVLERDQHLFNRNFQNALQGELISTEKHFPGTNGDTYHFEIVYHPVTDDAGKIIGVCMSSENITARKQAEIALQKREELYRLLADNSEDLIVLYTPEGRLKFASPSLERMLHYPFEQLFTIDWLQVIHPDDRQMIINNHQNILATGEIAAVEHRIQRKEGDYIFVETNLTPIPNEEGQVTDILAASRDITERKAAEHALAESETRFRQLAENIDEVFWLIDVENHQVLYVSPAFEHIWQRDPAEFLDDLPSIAETFHPEDRDYVVENTWLKFHAPHGLQEKISVEYRIIRPSDEVRWVHSDYFPVKDADGASQRVAGLTYDITERRRLEQQRRRLILETERSRLQAEFVKGISHEFRTPLAVIASSTYLMKRHEDPDARADKAQQINEQISLLTRLIDSMLLLTELDMIDKLETQKVKIDTLLGVVIDKLSSQAQSKNLTINYHNPVATLELDCEASLLHEACYQVLHNAIRYSPPYKTITIAVDTSASDCRITFTDQGVGITSEQLTHIFDRFYRGDTEHSTEGLGLGLPIVRQIVTLHDGHLFVESEPGLGATFTIQLPANYRASRPN